MKLKGDLDSIGLAELFKTLADQQATGVLSISSSMGEKHIALAHGEVAVHSDVLAERARIGDLLVARGKINETQLVDALKAQKASPRTRLGDVLAKQGLITAQDIDDALRFQLEEEIYDLFTWKGGSFDFDGDKSIDDEPADEKARNVHRLYIKPDAIIAEATRRISEWNTIESRLPTPYLCFRLAPKGEELVQTASPAAQRIIKLLKEGRTIETTVKRSCMGRLAVSKAIIKFLDDGWIFPYPAADLPLLAAEHRAQKRYADALNIYRRLLEVNESESERTELETLMAATIEAIHQAKDSGESPDSLEIFSHKRAAEKYIRRKLYRRIALAAFGVVGVGVSLFMLLGRYRPAQQLPEEYQAAIRAADTAMDSGQIDVANEIWQKFYMSLPDKESDIAKRAQERRLALTRRYNTYIENLLLPVEGLEKQSKLDEAQAGYKQLLEKYPKNPFEDRINEGLVRVKTKKETRQVADQVASLEGKMKEAREYIQKKNYTPAKARFTEISAAAPTGTAPRREADEALKRLDEIEERSRNFVRIAESALLEQKAESAIASYDQAASEWPDIPSGKQAREQSERLKKKLSGLKEALKDADMAEADGRILDALAALSPLDRIYSEFESIAGAKKRIAALNAQAAEVDKQIALAQAAATSDKARARQLFTDLMIRQSQFMTSRNVEVPMRIATTPKGAILKIDGKEIGPTPQEIMISMSKPFSMSLELPGYEPFETKFAGLSSKDLEFLKHLPRKPLKILELSDKNGIVAPPKVLNGVLYVFHGTSSLSAFEPNGNKLWSTDNIPVSAKAQDPDEFSRNNIEPLPDGKLLLTLRGSRDLFQFSPADRTTSKILTLPENPAGRSYVEPKSLLGGSTLIATPCADGMIRVYDVANPNKPLWEKPIVPPGASGKETGKFAAGLVSRAPSFFLGLSVSGRMAAYNVVNGNENVIVELKKQIAGGNIIPDSTDESVAALVHADGKVTAVDLSREEKIWELPVEQALEEAFAATVRKNGVYVLTREGRVSKYSAERSSGKPPQVWQRRLDGPSEIPMAADKAIYIACSSGHLYALSMDDGREVWDYRMDGKPLYLQVYGNYLYVATTDGHLIILSTE